MYDRPLVIATLLFLLPLPIFCQDSDEQSEVKKFREFYAYWGWNREVYTHSDIHFTGSDHDFILHDVEAVDRPSEFDFKTYFSPAKLSIPQYNFRIGYRMDEHWDFSVGTDHMKYVVLKGQEVTISGRIDEDGSPYAGTYDNDRLLISKDFLELEHTDGLNYVNVAARRSDKLFERRWFALDITEGVGTGVLIPRTDATLLGRERHDEFHLAGYGFSAMTGLRFRFWDIFFIQTELKGGYINMPDIRTTHSKMDKAQQSFGFLQYNAVFGARFSLSNSKE